MKTPRRITTFMLGAVMLAIPAGGQERAPFAPQATPYLDEFAGVGLDVAIARALDREPSLRGVRADIDVARGLQQPRTYADVLSPRRPHGRKSRS